MTTINLQPTAALGFFIAAGVLAYYSPEHPALAHFAKSALWWFALL